jgi:hypothetical protein
MKPVVATAGAGPLALADLYRLLQRLIGRARGKIEQGRCTAMQGGAADLFRRRAQHVLVAAGKRDRRAAMDMRIDPARNDDLAVGVDGARGTGGGEAAGSADSCDLAAGDADIGGLGGGRHDRQTPGNDQVEHSAPPFD